jgi:hypothetical protein
MKKKCPLMKGPCIENQCEFWHTIVMNKFSPDGSSVPESVSKCVFTWIPILLIENAKETRQAAASTDKVANEMNASASQVLLGMVGKRLGMLEAPHESKHNSS